MRCQEPEPERVNAKHVEQYLLQNDRPKMAEFVFSQAQSLEARGYTEVRLRKTIDELEERLEKYEPKQQQAQHDYTDYRRRAPADSDD